MRKDGVAYIKLARCNYIRLGAGQGGDSGMTLDLNWVLETYFMHLPRRPN